MKYIYRILLIAVFVLASCSTPKVTYDRHTDFSRYHNFAYIKKDLLDAPLYPQIKKIIATEVHRTLLQKNLTPSKKPDLLVRIIPSVHKRVDVYVRRDMFGLDKTKYESHEGTITVELIDFHSKKTVWRTTFYINFNSNRSLKKVLDKKLSQAFAHFPPEVSK